MISFLLQPHSALQTLLRDAGKAAASLPIFAGQCRAPGAVDAARREPSQPRDEEGAAAFGCSGVCLPEPCCLHGSHGPRSKQASERLKGIEKGSSRTSSEVFPQHKYLYSSDVGFTSTHSTLAGRACKHEQDLYVLTTYSCLPLSLWLSLLCSLLFFVCLNQGNVVSGKRAS